MRMVWKPNCISMNCPQCYNPIQEDTTSCEWCNFVLLKKNVRPKGEKFLVKGECLFFSTRIPKTHCFYEVYADDIVIFDAEEKLNIVLTKDIIFNIQPYRRYAWLHFIPLIGTIVRFFILLFKKYKRGFSFITSKSGKNTMIIRQRNFTIFNYQMTTYLH